MSPASGTGRADGPGIARWHRQPTPTALASFGPDGAPLGLRGTTLSRSSRRRLRAGARRGLAFRRSTIHCTSIRTSGVATSEKCLQIGVRKIIGAESHPLRRAQCLFRSHSRHSACVPITSGLPRKGDIFRARRTSHLCHNEHPNGIRHERSTWRAGARGRSAKRIGTVSARRA
jgi:hypothetical protein